MHLEAGYGTGSYSPPADAITILGVAPGFRQPTSGGSEPPPVAAIPHPLYIPFKDNWRNGFNDQLAFGPAATMRLYFNMLPWVDRLAAAPAGRYGRAWHPETLLRQTLMLQLWNLTVTDRAADPAAPPHVLVVYQVPLVNCLNCFGDDKSGGCGCGGPHGPNWEDKPY